jgi:YVTN family beta-propeller protein
VLLSLFAFFFTLLSPQSGAQTPIATVQVGTTPVALAVNSTTNKIFAVNRDSNNVTVIDGASNGIAAVVAVGQSPSAIAVNSVTNKIYVTNRSGSTLSVIDGATNTAVALVPVGQSPIAVAVNPATNRIYAVNQNSSSVTVIDGGSNSVIATVPVGSHPQALAVNPITGKAYIANTGDASVTVVNGTTPTRVYTGGSDPYAVAVNAETNLIYVANLGGSVSVIDGGSDELITNVTVGATPRAVAVNPASNQIYTANFGDGTVSAIDGASNTSTAIAAGNIPFSLAVNPVTNKIYVANNVWYGTATMLDGVNGSLAATVPVGIEPDAIALNATTNMVYVANSGSGTVSVIAGASSDPLQFVAVAPCRVADTRNPNGPFGGPAISGGTSRDFAIPNSACGVPATAAGYALNVSVVPLESLGYLTAWPAGEDQPFVATLNSLDGRIKGNAAIVPAGAGGAISIFATNNTHVILDINGYFAPVSGSTLAFYPLAPCRVADTRNPVGDLGGPYLKGLAAGRAFPILEASSCNIPSTAQAYSLNFAAVPHGPLGYLTAWPTGQNQPLVATLNAVTGTITANASIVPAGQGGNISVYATNDTDLVIDINGYFAPPGKGGLSLYPVAPCRVLDTRLSRGLFSGQLSPPVNVVGVPCGVSSAAKAFVLNATVVPQGMLGYLTLWPDGAPQPLVSTLNAIDGAITSNMAVVPTSNGSIDVYAPNPTQLVLDSFSYFGP